MSDAISKKDIMAAFLDDELQKFAQQNPHDELEIYFGSAGIFNTMMTGRGCMVIFAFKNHETGIVQGYMVHLSPGKCKYERIFREQISAWDQDVPFDDTKIQKISDIKTLAEKLREVECTTFVAP